MLRTIKERNLWIKGIMGVCKSGDEDVEFWNKDGRIGSRESDLLSHLLRSPLSTLFRILNFIFLFISLI